MSISPPLPSDALEMAEHLPHMVWIAGPDGKVSFFSRRFFEQTGLRPADLQREGWVRAIHPEDREHMRQVWEQALAAGQPYEVELRLQQAGGKDHRWHLAAARPALDEEGAVQRWYGSLFDIHDRITADEALRASEAQLRAIHESEPECVKLVSPEGSLLQPTFPKWRAFWRQDRLTAPVDQAFSAQSGVCGRANARS